MFKTTAYHLLVAAMHLAKLLTSTFLSLDLIYDIAT